MSPCIRECKLVEGTCIGCLRTVDEIVNWSNMSMADRMDVMEDLKSRTLTRCPECGSPNKCAMEDGKSINSCWCFALPFGGSPAGDSCLCRACLTKEET